MRFRHWTALLLLATGLLIGAPTRGHAQDDADEALQRHIRQAVAAVKAENFDEAADHYLAAHAISPRPILLYNAAYALGRAGRLKRALDVSDRAGEEGLEDPKAAARNRARRSGWSTILAARERADEASRTSRLPSSPRPASAARSEPPALEWLGAGTMVAGGGMLVGAALLDAQIGREADRLRAARDDGDREDYDRALTNIESLQNGGRILIVGGSALLAGGATLALWGLLDGNENQTAVAPAIGPDGSFGIRLRGTL